MALLKAMKLFYYIKVLILLAFGINNFLCIPSGLVSEPSNISVTSGLNTITISWSAPFSLDVTDVDHDIWYSVLIYNMTDEPTVISCTDCINIIETYYTFTPDYPSPCHKYIFIVIPFNGAGQGSTSNETMGYIHAGIKNIIIDIILCVLIYYTFYQFLQVSQFMKQI